MKVLALAFVTLMPAIAAAWPRLPMELPPADPEPEPEPPPQPVVVPAPVPAPDAPTPDLPTIEELARRLDEVEDKLSRTQSAHKSVVQELERLRPLPHFITAYLDVGAFSVSGNGAGTRSDNLHVQYPEYRNVITGQWMFMGDPFTTMINTLGEPAETGDSREVENDTVNSAGHPTILVNTLALAVSKDFGKGVSMVALAQFLPRPGPDVLDVALAHVDYRPFEGDLDLVIEAGKIDSVLGVEYRNQDAPKRVGITPSLIARYTSGRPTGIDARLNRGALTASAAIINGDNFDERFETKDTLKASAYPTAAGHVQWNIKELAGHEVGQGLEIGASGAVGPQDVQSNKHVHQWHYGFDVNLKDYKHWNVVAEFVQGKQQGSTTGDPDSDAMLGIERPRCDVTRCLTYKGAYVFADRWVSPRFTLYGRVDWRDAHHKNGAVFIYESHSIRATAGVRMKVASRVFAKAEYDFNYEIGVPYFPHDVITTSIVVATD